MKSKILILNSIGFDPFGAHSVAMIGCKSHKQNHEVEVARAILILGTGGGIR